MNDNGRYLFLVNPKAGKGNGQKALETLKSSLKNYTNNYSIEVTEFPKHAISIIKEKQNDFNTIVAMGGDGTLNEVINGLDISKDFNLGLLPVGSGNDYAFSLNLSKSFQDNLDLIFNHNISGESAIRIGKATIFENETQNEVEHRFINALGIGFDAIVAHHNQSNKILSGILSYITAIVKTIKEYQPISMSVDLGNNLIIKGNKLLLTVGKGKTSGGGFYLTPKAKFFDDQFEICIIEYVKTLKLLRSLPKALVNKLDTLPEAFFHFTDVVNLELDSPTFIHSDGEVLSRAATKVKIELLKGNTRVISNLRGA